MIVDRMAGTAQADVACMKMLVAVDRYGPLFGQSRADAVGALNRLGPDGAGPQAPAMKGVVVAGRAATLHRHAGGVAQQNAASRVAHGQEQPIQHALRRLRHRLHRLARGPQLPFGQGDHLTPTFRVQTIQRHRPSPRRRQRRPRRSGPIVQHLFDQAAVVVSRSLAHGWLPGLATGAIRRPRTAGVNATFLRRTAYHQRPGLAVKPAARSSAAPTWKTVASSSALPMT